MFSTMGKIIFCDDLILRVDDKEDLTNITEWLIESTEYRPASPESCTVRSEMTSSGKISMILIVWLGLILFTFVYFYFCEWKLFPKRNRLKEMADLGFRVGECIESCPSRANKKRGSTTTLTSSIGVSCDGNCCNSDLQHISSQQRHSSIKSTTSSSFRSSSSGYGSSTKLLQLDGSPKQRRPRNHINESTFASHNKNLNRRMKVTKT